MAIADNAADQARPARAATSFDVAQRAGVSRSTVSNILNGNDARFPEETRQRVREAAADLDYRPSPAGRFLVSGRSDTVVLLLPNTTFGTNLQDAVDEVVSGILPIGGNVLVRFVGEDTSATIDAILPMRPLAIVDFGVLPTAERERLESHGVLTVPRDRFADDEMPDGGISKIQATALVRAGHSRLWFASLSDSRSDPYGPGRLAGLQKFCAAERLPEPGHVRVALTREGGELALDEILSNSQQAGVVCYNDDVAMAILSAAEARGIRTPLDLAVVGVDHTPIGQLWSPRLATIDTDMRGFVEDVAEELRFRLAGEPSSNGPRIQQFRYIPGETV